MPAMFRLLASPAVALTLLVPLVPFASEGRLTVIPGLKVSPEVGIGLGTLAVHPAQPRAGSRMEYGILLTTRGQTEMRVSNRTADFLGTPWEATFEGGFQRSPDNYWGGGNSPADADEVEYTPLGGYAFTEFIRPLPGPANLFAGLRVDLWEIDDIRRANGNPGAAAVLGPHVTGHDGGVTDHWEIGLEIDTRDNKDVPSRGVHAGQRLGLSAAGDFRYQAAETWAAGYRALGARWEIAGKLWQRTLFGDPPFFLEPALGNEDVLRGVPHKRFRDRSAQAAQAEIRFGFPLALPAIDAWLGRDWQIAAFAETGRVGPDFAAASRESLNYSAGFGGRLVFNDRVGAMRGDVGFSRHGLAVIIKFNQAF